MHLTERVPPGAGEDEDTTKEDELPELPDGLYASKTMLTAGGQSTCRALKHIKPVAK